MNPQEEPLNLESLRLDRGDSELRYLRSRRRRTLIIFTLIFIVAALSLWWFFTGSPWGPKVQVAPVIKIYPSQAVTLLNASGYVVAQRKASVSSKRTRSPLLCRCRGRQPGEKG